MAVPTSCSAPSPSSLAGEEPHRHGADDAEHGARRRPGAAATPTTTAAARRAASGLILSEGTVVDRPASRNLPAIPFFHGERRSAGWGG